MKHKQAYILINDTGERSLNSENGTTGTSWTERERTQPWATSILSYLILPTILRLQTTVKLIMLSTVLINGLESNGASGLSPFTIRHDTSERQEESLGANLLASGQIDIVEGIARQFIPVWINTWATPKASCPPMHCSKLRQTVNNSQD